MKLARTSLVRRNFFILGSLALMSLSGCGGSGSNSADVGTAEVSGIISDSDGNPVRGAKVYTATGTSRQTVSNSSGAYLLTGVDAKDLVVRAEVDQGGGLRFVGENLARAFRGERSRSVNIAVVRDNQLATIQGTVYDRNGNVIEGARVFAFGNALSSSMAVTDRSGHYAIKRLQAGQPYDVWANGVDLTTDTDYITLNAGETRQEDFTLSFNNNFNLLPPPENLHAVAWTSPQEITRSVSSARQYEALKQIFDPKRAERAATKTATRDTAGGNFIEVDLDFDYVDSTHLIGYAIYRGAGDTSNFNHVDYLRDPLAFFFADSDDFLHQNQTYSYAVSSINSNADEGDLSPHVVVETLGDLELADETQGSNLTFHWLPAPGAENYVVLLFDQEPTFSIDELWRNATPTTNTSITYDGPSLQSGHRYWYVVFGVANGGDSRTISRVASFIAN